MPTRHSKPEHAQQEDASRAPQHMLIVPYAEKPPLVEWPVMAFRVLGLLLLAAFCVLAWAACIAVVLLGPLWGVGGALIAFLCLAGGFACLGVEP